MAEFKVEHEKRQQDQELIRRNRQADDYEKSVNRIWVKQDVKERQSNRQVGPAKRDVSKPLEGLREQMGGTRTRAVMRHLKPVNNE